MRAERRSLTHAYQMQDIVVLATAPAEAERAFWMPGIISRVLHNQQTGGTYDAGNRLGIGLDDVTSHSWPTAR
jgi:hypothetical protein